jgi:hypothetical protein
VRSTKPTGGVSRGRENYQELKKVARKVRMMLHRVLSENGNE